MQKLTRKEPRIRKRTRREDRRRLPRKKLSRLRKLPLPMQLSQQPLPLKKLKQRKKKPKSPLKQPNQPKQRKLLFKLITSQYLHL